MSTSRVLECVEQVYAAFAAQPHPRQIDACPCCADRANICTLLSTPLRQLTPDELSSYAASVFLTVGRESDFRFFLPRILEISVSDRSWWPALEVVLERLVRANWDAWPQEETEPLLRLFEAAFDESIVLPENAASEVDSWLCALAIAGVDVAPYLRKLQAPAAEEVMSDYFVLNAPDLRKGRLANPFWKDHSDKAAPVIAVLKSPGVRSAIRRLYGAEWPE